MTDRMFEASEIVLETGIFDGRDGNVLNAAGFGGVPERDGDLVWYSSMLRYRLRNNISNSTVKAIQDYLITFGSGRAILRTINGTVFLQPRTQLDVDLLCCEMGQFVTGWKVEK
ncbi:hypothetical protein VSX64_20420 [Aurantimonas sp. C2-6-R+9]|uniref:hypothetical protein n=1 Tax=unclassified Aurantimonas TaxID=2638230 RepID=UPI002E1893EC|nr:hypothetical protein [Aurantimonas sp. C2-6-R+9]